jgi:hypothetical protein
MPLRVVLSLPDCLSLYSSGFTGQSDWERGGRTLSVDSSLGLVDFPSVKSGVMPSDCVLSVSSSDVGGPWMEALVVLAAWCWWLLFKVFFPRSKNKLGVLGMAPEAMADSICSSVVIAQDPSLLFAAHHGGENGMGLLVLVLLHADLRL